MLQVELDRRAGYVANVLWFLTGVVVATLLHP